MSLQDIKSAGLFYQQWGWSAPLHPEMLSDLFPLG
jgi:hypothetical protein